MNNPAFEKSAYSGHQEHTMNHNKGFNNLQNQIINVLKMFSHTSEGGDINDIIHRLRGISNENEIRYL